MLLATFLVEDNASIREQLVPSLLELANAAVVGVAVSESEAKSWLGIFEGPLDLVIIDLFLVEGSGLGVLGYMREHSFKVPRVVLTNYATDSIRDRCIALGATLVFDKSTELDEFMAYCVSLGRRP